MIELLTKLIKEHEEELIIIEKSHDENRKAGMHVLAEKRDTQAVLVRRFIKDLKKLNDCFVPQPKQEVCESCTDNNGNNIGNMYVCPNCGRSVD